MSPIVFKWHGFQFYVRPEKERRAHIHVYGHGGSAKFWLEPTVSLSKTTGLSKRDLLQLWTVVDERKDQLIETWHEYH
jgi:hypothetical protein